MPDNIDPRLASVLDGIGYAMTPVETMLPLTELDLQVVSACTLRDFRPTARFSLDQFEAVSRYLESHFPDTCGRIISAASSTPQRRLESERAMAASFGGRHPGFATIGDVCREMRSQYVSLARACVSRMVGFDIPVALAELWLIHSGIIRDIARCTKSDPEAAVICFFMSRDGVNVKTSMYMLRDMIGDTYWPVTVESDAPVVETPRLSRKARRRINQKTRERGVCM